MCGRITQTDSPITYAQMLGWQGFDPQNLHEGPTADYNAAPGALHWTMRVLEDDRSESLRRLHLAAQSSETTFWMIRPLAHAQDALPSPLRLGLRPARSGIAIDMLKRRGPQRTEPFYLMLPTMPSTPLPALVPSTPDSSLPLSSFPDHAFLDKRAFAAAAARNLSPALV